MDYIFDFFNTEKLRFIFLIVSLFSLQIVFFFSIFKIYKYYIDYTSNKSLIKDFNKGLNFNRFIEECKILESNSSFSRVILHGYRDFIKYKDNKSIIYLIRSSLEEQLMEEMIIKNKYLNIFQFTTLFMVYFGFIFFLVESINSFSEIENFNIYIVLNIKYLIVSLMISFISSICYFVYKTINNSYYKNQKLYSESFINFIQKNIINE